LLDSGQPKTESILQYLAKVEAREINPHLADDIRIAWLTVLHAASGVCDAWGFSFWQFFGKTYPKALLAWAERDEVNRKALERCAEMVRQRDRLESNGFTERSASSNGMPAMGSLERAVGGHARPVSESGALSGRLYESARQFLSLPPKKPARAEKRGKKAA
jgi:hypothetical protein